MNAIREMSHEWHCAINRHTEKHGHDGRSWMYEAKDACLEVPRLARILGQERRGELPKRHRQCSMSPTEKIEDNHLRCCLGKECRKCPELLALEVPALTPEQQDEA